MDILNLKQLIREIIQSEITPEPRGAKQQGEKSSYLWHTYKGAMYREKNDKYPYLWWIDGEKMSSKSNSGIANGEKVEPKEPIKAPETDTEPEPEK
jgi:hypothetical protein